MYNCFMEVLVRINKYISDTGFCSRREADRLVEDGLVTVNGQKAETGTKISSSDSVKVRNKLIIQKNNKIYMAFNKPRGITCTTDEREKDNIISYIGYKERIFPIGRLDKMSEGLIFLTNDGDIVNKILRAGNNHEKEYIVTVNKPITHDFTNKMSRGVRILKTRTLPCKVEQINNYKFKIILTQGLNRQIRRMCEKLGYNVVKLIRTRIMNVNLNGIKPGQWRYLTDAEMKKINSLSSDSIKTEEASNLRSKKYYQSDKKSHNRRPK